jgi:hypothetical protein
MDVDSLKLALGAVVAVAALWFAITRLARFLSWVEQSEIARQEAEKAGAVAPGAAPPAPEGVPPHHVAAIAAAVAACGYRVVHIADAGAGHAWAAEGRRLHQTSHRPH